VSDLPDLPRGSERVLASLLRRSHDLEPDELPAAVAGTARQLGAQATAILLADYEQEELRHLAEEPGAALGPQSVEGSLAGRAYRTSAPVEHDDGSTRRLLLPLVDGTHRIGVLELQLDREGPADLAALVAFAALVADLVLTKSAYGDTVEVTRRRRPAALRAEAQRALLPPLTLMSRRMLLTGMLVPAYEVAGDLFDYALNGDVLHFAVFDAMGHSLGATLTASVAVAGYRNARRSGGSLTDVMREADAAVAAEFAGERFATALLGELDLSDGMLRTVSAGHPSGLVVRQNRVVARCADDPTLPLGLGGDAPVVVDTPLEPGDRVLLFTDGIVEARSADGTYFGEEQLVDGIAKELDSGLPPAEAVRRLVRSVVAHQDGDIGDDATLLLVEWRGADPALTHPNAD
jgi:serine phosphatase RsbU (regulator of sigma subunit)